MSKSEIGPQGSTLAEALSAAFFALRTYALWGCNRVIFGIVIMAYIPGCSLNLVRGTATTKVRRTYARSVYHAIEGCSHVVGHKVRHLEDISDMVLTMILGVSRRTAILLLLTYALSQCTGPLVLHTVRHPRVVTIFGRVKEVSWITRDRNALRLLCESRYVCAVR